MKRETTLIVAILGVIALVALIGVLVGRAPADQLVTVVTGVVTGLLGYLAKSDSTPPKE